MRLRSKDDTEPESNQDCENTQLNIVKDGDPEELKSYEEAIRSKDANRWLEAMNEEMESLQRHNVWELEELRPGAIPVNCRSAFKKKIIESAGGIEKFKARLVAKGFTQKRGIDYEDVYTPVSGFEIIRLLTALAVQKNWRLDQYDVKSAYLHSDLKENIYMWQPKRFERKGCEKLYCKLKKSIYGLKQSGRCWNEHLDKELKKAGFNRNGVDPCVYEMNTDCGRAILAVYVDDIFVISENLTMQQKVRRKLESRFESKYLGPTSNLLGVKFNQLKDGSVTLSQSEYIDSLLNRFGLQDAKEASTPMEERPSFLDHSDKEPQRTELPFRELIGGLLYLSQRTRPDIAFAVGKLAQYCSNFNEQHWNAAKRILRYLKGTKDNAINYKQLNEPLMAYSDADWASDINNRRSTTGYVLTLSGSPVIWRSAKQTTVALSTMEAEYVTLAECAREVTWVRQFLISLGS